VYSLIAGFSGDLVIALVILKGIFSKGVAYFGVVTSIIGVVSGIPIPALGITLAIGFILFGIWSLFVGYRLHKLGRS